MKPSEVVVCREGSVEAAALKIGRDAAEQGMFDLTQSAPEEIRGSWSLVVQWGRLQIAYEDAMTMGDVKLAAQVAKMCSDMVSGLY